MKWLRLPKKTASLPDSGTYPSFPGDLATTLLTIARDSVMGSLYTKILSTCGSQAEAANRFGSLLMLVANVSVSTLLSDLLLKPFSELLITGLVLVMSTRRPWGNGESRSKWHLLLRSQTIVLQTAGKMHAFHPLFFLSLERSSLL